MNRARRGRGYERVALDYLRGDGYDIIAANYRHGRNEIDIVCRKNNELVFVEVKGGRSSAFGDPVYRVDDHKAQGDCHGRAGVCSGINCRLSIVPF